MSVSELQKTIRQLSPSERRTLSTVALRMMRKRRMAKNRSAETRAMLSVLGCARRVLPGKSSQQILAKLRGYDRAEL